MHITIQASVGYLGHNRPFDVMNTKAAINVYFRSVKRATMEVCAGSDDEFVDAIKYVQKHALNLSQIDGLIRPNDKLAKWLSRYWLSSFKAPAIPKPSVGLLAWESEGHEGGYHHSRKLHVPSESSGLTIGRGYDCSQRDLVSIVKDLTSAGVQGEVAVLLARAAKLKGSNVRYFIIKNDLLDWELSAEAQVKLFELIYPVYENRAKDQYNKAVQESERSHPAWPELHQKIRDVLIDLSYRGEYHSGNRGAVFDAVIHNNVQKALTFFSDRTKWPRVPPDRFERRIKHLKQG